MIAPRPANIHRQVLDALGHEICTASVTTLPNEAALCVRFGASRTIVREAGEIPRGQGLAGGAAQNRHHHPAAPAVEPVLEVRPKTGTTIRPRRQWNLLDPDVVAWQSAGALDARFVADLAELRRIIEPSAAPPGRRARHR
ncbi:MAG: hypothetical protein WDN49_11460 [Acetobacteraceae bacterium]